MSKTDEIERLMEPYRNKWIGDHEEMIADLKATVIAAMGRENEGGTYFQAMVEATTEIARLREALEKLATSAMFAKDRDFARAALTNTPEPKGGNE